ncbi:ribosyldihydronicotinamide dehydrogenase [Caballeronia arationis]|jgi:putative NADPH-quinone reductase|uniref:NADPH-quinone reductase (Modulator of drug activity B) n=1 Tax=Caballeronia arationis TaxID=1777142 RepID=A0A7Z7N6M8_9BURK|nr:NAD(P)H-dependent oxidoreductase [Caballeronia arationis]SAK57206.1 ribosyldihydronicotinamide dehydrogenase [Caballeronia arationis]SOE88229.1 Putative NADPH-quinone reductase (modulator of drug activity B) [Caballeronia arationis]
MPGTSILVFHPYLSRSRANSAWLAAARTLPGVEIADMYALYPAQQIDADREVARLLSADRIVIQFPVQWYSTPPLVKAWQDAVLTRMFYLSYESEGRRLEGTPLMVAATAGNVPAAYSGEGVNLFPLEELLRPLEASAHRCGLPWSAPHLLYAADKLDERALRAAGDSYAARLGEWIALNAAT